jgi:hypothetical protein
MIPIIYLEQSFNSTQSISSVLVPNTYSTISPVFISITIFGFLAIIFYIIMRIFLIPHSSYIPTEIRNNKIDNSHNENKKEDIKYILYKE